MSERQDHRRNISAHRLPVRLESMRPRLRENAPQSTFLAQLLAGMPATARAGRGVDPGKHRADAVYRQTETSDVKRVPAGYRKSLDA